MNSIKHRVYTFIGILLIGAAVAGLAISVTGIFGVWRLGRSMKTGLIDTLALLETTLQTTADGITIAGQSLDQAIVSLDTLASTLATTGQSVHDTIPVLEALTQVTTQDVPQTILTTQQALASAQASAAVVDSTLTLLTSLPLLPITPYRPNVALSDALGNISTSLEPIPATLASMEESMTATSRNLVIIDSQFGEMGTDLAAINTSLAQAQAVTTQYLQVTATLQQQVAVAKLHLPAQLDAISGFITIALVWLGLTQIGLMMQGLEMMGLEFVRPPAPTSGTPESTKPAEPPAVAQASPTQRT